MLTPQEVSDRGFTKVSFGGYNMIQVDEFLDIVTGDYTTLYSENTALKRKMKVMQDKIDEYRTTEETMRKALLAAQQIAENMVSEGKNKSERIMDEARAEIESLRKNTFDERKVEEQRLMSVKQVTAQYVEQVRDLHRKEMEYLDSLGALVMGDVGESAMRETAPSRMQSAEMAHMQPPEMVQNRMQPPEMVQNRMQQPEMGHMPQPEMGHMQQPEMGHMQQPEMGHMQQPEMGHMQQHEMGHMQQPEMMQSRMKQPEMVQNRMQQPEMMQGRMQQPEMMQGRMQPEPVQQQGQVEVPSSSGMSNEVQMFLERAMADALGEKKAAELSEENYGTLQQLYQPSHSEQSMPTSAPESIEATTRFLLRSDLEAASKPPQQVVEDHEYDAELARSGSRLDFSRLQQEFGHNNNNT